MILITGAAGYIGSHTCVELLNSGFDIIAVDDFTNSNIESIIRVQMITGKKFDFFEMNIMNAGELEKLFSHYNIKAVIHFAGSKSVYESVTNPIKYYKNNITSTLVLIEVMNKYNVKNMIFSSSATVYGKPTHVPIDENSKLEVTNPYGRSKLILEEILLDIYNSDKNWNIVLLRYFNPIGAHETGVIGEDPKGIPNNLLPFVSQVAIGIQKSVNIFGNDYDTIDGTGVRDYIHVVDLARGHLKSIDKLFNQCGYRVYNLGTGKGYSVLEVISAFEKVANKKINYTFQPRRNGDIAICYADPSKANIELDWYAEKELDEMCRDAWNWQVNNPTGYEKKEIYEGEI